MKFLKIFLLTILLIAILIFVAMPLGYIIAGDIGAIVATIITLIISLVIYQIKYKNLFTIFLKFLKTTLLIVISYILLLIAFIPVIQSINSGEIITIITLIITLIASFFIYKHTAKLLKNIYILFKIIINHLLITSLIVCSTFIFMGIGYLLGGSKGVTIAFIIEILIILFHYLTSDKVLLTILKAKPADEKEFKLFYDITKEQTQKAHMPMPKLFIMESKFANALAAGLNKKNAKIAITANLLKIFNKEELSALIAHELAHIKNNDAVIRTIVAILANIILIIGKMLIFFRSTPNPIILTFIIILAPINIMLIKLAVSRKDEYAADKVAAILCGNPFYLISALQKLEAYNNALTSSNKNKPLIPKSNKDIVDSIFDTHPETENRIKCLEEQASLLKIPAPLTIAQNNETPTTVNAIKDNPWV